MGAHRVPIRGPEGARKEKSRSVADGSTNNFLHVGARWVPVILAIKSPAQNGLDRDNYGQN